MKIINDIDNSNLRHLARMENAMDQFDSKLLDLQTLIGELEFLRDALDCFPDDYFKDLNNRIMDLESINCAMIDGESFPEIPKVLKQSIEKINRWIELAKDDIESGTA